MVPILAQTATPPCNVFVGNVIETERETYSHMEDLTSFMSAHVQAKSPVG